VLTVDEDDKVVCHVCGNAYNGLDHHARQAHDLWPEEYRVLFGLARGRALESPTLRSRRRVLADERLRPWRERVGELTEGTTPEQRAARGRGKTRRLETLQDPENRASWREGGRRARRTRRARIAAGHQERPQGFQAGSAAAREASAKGWARRAELLEDPTYRAAVARRVSAGKGGRAASMCLVCREAFEVPPSWLRGGYGKICSAACRTQWKLQRGRGREGLPWQEIAARLRARGPAALDELAPPGPEIVRRFYGLIDGSPWTQRAIAEHLGLSLGKVRGILGSPAVTRLLGEPPRRGDRTVVSVTCAICGTSVEREPHELRNRARTTCSPACRKELRRRHLAARPPLDAATHVKAGESFRHRLAASAEFREQWQTRMRQAGLRRGRPHTEALRALAPEAFAGLDERDQELVQRYYGLAGFGPESQRSLAARFHMDGARVGPLVQASVTRLLSLKESCQPRQRRKRAPIETATS